jgi:NDP-sugar pyrophosphorylase family protein
MKAVILAAGMGTRLRPLTDLTPKCLVPVGGKAMLEYQLEGLAEAGLQECVLVVGYRGSQITNRIGNNHRGVAISYVENPRYQETNNLYSLWLAKDWLDDDIVLIEGDLLFEVDLIRQLIQYPASSVAVVDQYQDTMDGTVMVAENSIASAMILKKDQGPQFNYRSALKTVNVYKLSRSTMRNLVIPELSRRVEQGNTDLYYEAIFADLIAEQRLQMSVLRTGTLKWAEVDTIDDLFSAQAMFGRKPTAAELPALNR